MSIGSSDAAKTTNSMPVEAFKSISRRVVRRLGSSSVALLTPSEEREAMSSLGLVSDELKSVVHLCSFMFEQAAYQMQRPEEFEKYLVQSIHVDASHAAAARAVWESEAASYVARLREKHILGGKSVLKDTTWNTQLCLAQKGEAPRSIQESTTAIIDLRLGGDDDSRSDESSLILESSHAELYDFFQKLQDVQRTIDKLSSPSS